MEASYWFVTPPSSRVKAKRNCRQDLKKDCRLDGAGDFPEPGLWKQGANAATMPVRSHILAEFV
jgi:hypothetical protein